MARPIGRKAKSPMSRDMQRNPRASGRKVNDDQC